MVWALDRIGSTLKPKLVLNRRPHKASLRQDGAQQWTCPMIEAGPFGLNGNRIGAQEPKQVKQYSTEQPRRAHELV